VDVTAISLLLRCCCDVNRRRLRSLR